MPPADPLTPSIVARLPSTVVVVDTALRVLARSEAVLPLAGRDPLGEPWTAALPPALLAAADLERHVARALATGRDVALLRVDVELDGASRSFRVDVVPVDQPPARLLVHLADLTDTVALEARTRREEALLQLGALSAAVAHELRNPLAGISGAVQVIRASLPRDDPRVDVLRKVEAQAHRVDMLVTDLLAFARQDEAHMAPVDLHAVAAGLVADLPAGDRARVRVLGRGGAHADGALVRAAIEQLVANGLEACRPSGRVQVLVRAGEVVVADAGAGVSAAHADRIFEPFFTTRTRGSGLGLAIARRAAHAMLGTLELHTERPLGGAAFRLGLQPPLDA